MPRSEPNRQKTPLLAWPGVLCLDAPLVAVGWLWLLVAERGGQLQPVLAASVFLFVWLIYAVDRFFPAFGLDAEEDTARHRFWFRHKKPLAGLIFLAVLGCLYLGFFRLPESLLWQATMPILLLVFYLLFSFSAGQKKLQTKPKIWLCGMLFALGIQLAAHSTSLPGLSIVQLPEGASGAQILFFAAHALAVSSGSMFFLLQGNTIFLGVGFALNCAAISLWQQEKNAQLAAGDGKMGEKSLAFSTTMQIKKIHHSLIFWAVLLLGLAVACLLARSGWWADVRWLRGLQPQSLLAMACSVGLLVFLHFRRAGLDNETLRFAADAVYLTPFLWIFCLKMLG